MASVVFLQTSPVVGAYDCYRQVHSVQAPKTCRVNASKTAPHMHPPASHGVFLWLHELF